MAKNKAKNSIKKIQKEITRLKVELDKLEIRPCQGDADMKKKDEDIILLKREIYDLEKEANQFAIFISGIGSGKHRGKVLT